MKINITFQLLENGKWQNITHSKAVKLLESGKYYQSNEIHFGDLTFLSPNETVSFILEPMRDDE